MKNLKNIFAWSVVMLYLIVVFGFISENESMSLCKKINITIDSTNSFFTQEKIIQIINEKEILGKPVNKINLKKLESVLLNQYGIKEAETWIYGNGELNISITQRVPVIRVMNSKNQDYYIDEDGYIFPYSNTYIPKVLIANGIIYEPFTINTTWNIYKIGNKELSNREKVIYGLLELGKYIHNNKFWSAQIQQIYVNNRYEFELIPRVGAHVILMGKQEDCISKLDNLKLLYLQGFNNIGWNHYVTINLKFKNQIICTKRI